MTIEVASEAELEKLRELFQSYYFVGEGLVKVGEKLRKGDLITTSATKAFIKKH